MVTKVAAARIAVSQGIPMLLMNGKNLQCLENLEIGECQGTVFLPRENRLVGKKSWLAFSTTPEGQILFRRRSGQGSKARQ